MQKDTCLKFFFPNHKKNFKHETHAEQEYLGKGHLGWVKFFFKNTYHGTNESLVE